MEPPVKVVRSSIGGSDVSDAEALERIAAGDVGSLAALYDRHARALLGFASRAVGSLDAEDVTHTVFVRAARLAGTYDARATSARSWLFGIAVKVIQERRRSLRRTVRGMTVARTLSGRCCFTSSTT